MHRVLTWLIIFGFLQIFIQNYFVNEQSEYILQNSAVLESKEKMMKNASSVCVTSKIKK